VGVALALDRQERGSGTLSAVQEVEQQEGLKCVSIVTLAELIEALSHPADGRARISAEQLTSLKAYRQRFGVV
jgi:orotate phosphoribosyltransferase